MIGCLTETTTCVVAKPLVTFIGSKYNKIQLTNCFNNLKFKSNLLHLPRAQALHSSACCSFQSCCSCFAAPVLLLQSCCYSLAPVLLQSCCSLQSKTLKSPQFIILQLTIKMLLLISYFLFREHKKLHSRLN